MKIMLSVPTYWSTVLNFLAHQYFSDSHATCFLWHSRFDVHLDISLPVLIMEPKTWSGSFPKDIYDFKAKQDQFELDDISYNDWILKLTVAIEQSHCETFIAFQEHIPLFARYFYNASVYSIWRSQRNRFIFAYTEELLEGKGAASYFDGYLFHDQPNLLLVASRYFNDSIFDIKTNRFVGPRHFEAAPKPAIFDVIQQFDAVRQKLLWDSGSGAALQASKLKDLQGREMVIAIFDYKPFMLLNHDKQPRVYDRAKDKEIDDVHIDGTEVRLMLTFCELRNCTIQADTSEHADWGDVFSNATGYGLVGMVLDRRNDYGIGAIYLWYEAYQFMDITHFLGRSGVTCLVPAPRPLINWALPLRPFQVTLWLCVMLCLLLECIALCCTRRCERKDGQALHSWRQSLRFGYVSTLKLFINQSTNYVATSYALRTLLLASYMVNMTVTTVYSGGLAAILTLPTLEEAADSRVRLFEHGLIWTGTSQAWITTIDIRAADPVLLGLMMHYRVFDADQIAAYSRTEQMAFVVERMQFDHLGNSELIADDALSRLKLMVDDIYYSFTVAHVPRLWPFLSIYNDFVLAWHSSGMDKYWEWKIAADHMNGNRQNRIMASQKPNLDIGPVQLGINNFIGLIMLWCFGMLCSLLAFLGELWCGRARTIAIAQL